MVLSERHGRSMTTCSFQVCGTFPVPVAVVQIPTQGSRSTMEDSQSCYPILDLSTWVRKQWKIVTHHDAPLFNLL
jgi:hypothetical protein